MRINEMWFTLWILDNKENLIAPSLYSAKIFILARLCSNVLNTGFLTVHLHFSNC